MVQQAPDSLAFSFASSLHIRVFILSFIGHKQHDLNGLYLQDYLHNPLFCQSLLLNNYCLHDSSGTAETVETTKQHKKHTQGYADNMHMMNACFTVVQINLLLYD